MTTKQEERVCMRCAARGPIDGFGHVYEKGAIVLVCHQCGRDDALAGALRDLEETRAKLRTVQATLFDAAVEGLIEWQVGGMQNAALAARVDRAVDASALASGRDRSEVAEDAAKQAVLRAIERKAKLKVVSAVERKTGGAA